VGEILILVTSGYLIFLIGILATFFSLWSTVPQIRKSLRTKKTDDVSKWLIICLIGGLSLWVLYGILKGDIIIIVANSIGVSLNLYLLFLKREYSKMTFTPSSIRIYFQLKIIGKIIDYGSRIK